jgi:hypothetical protein
MDFKKGDIVKIQKGDCVNLLGCILLGISDELQGNYIVKVEGKATHIVVTHREISLVRSKENNADMVKETLRDDQVEFKKPLAPVRKRKIECRDKESKINKRYNHTIFTQHLK